MDSLDGIYQRTSRIVNRVDERLRVSEYISYLKDLAIENPLTALCTLLVLGTVALPVLTFLFFAIATIGVTFVGFLFVNGTVITVAAVVFGGVILSFGAVALGFGAVIAAVYYCISQVASLVQRFTPGGSGRKPAPSPCDSNGEVIAEEPDTNGFHKESVGDGVWGKSGHTQVVDQNGWEKLE